MLLFSIFLDDERWMMRKIVLLSANAILYSSILISNIIIKEKYQLFHQLEIAFTQLEVIENPILLF